MFVHVYVIILFCSVLVCRYDRSVDLALREWVLQRVAEEEHVTRDEIKRKAFDMILPHNPNFQASNGWISRFLTRHKLSINSK